MLFSIVSSCSQCCECCETCLFESQCWWLHQPLSLLSVMIDFVAKKIPVWSSATSIHVTSVCSLFTDTLSTASLISCWSSWFLSYLKTTSRGACCRPSLVAQRSSWHRRVRRNRNNRGKSQCSSSSDQSLEPDALKQRECDPDEAFPGDNESSLLKSFRSMSWQQDVPKQTLKYFFFHVWVSDWVSVWNRKREKRYD